MTFSTIVWRRWIKIVRCLQACLSFMSLFQLLLFLTTFIPIIFFSTLRHYGLCYFYSAVPLILTYYYSIFICYTLLILIYLLTIKLFIAPYILMYSFNCAYLTYSYQITTVLISLCLLHVGNESQPELNLKLWGNNECLTEKIGNVRGKC